jgi:hypothetical protein
MPRTITLSGSLPALLSASVATAGLTLSSMSFAGGFLEDAKADLKLRNLYYDNDFRSGHGGAGSRQTEWAQGFMLNARSGFTEGTVGFGVDAMAFYGLKLDSGGKAGDPNSSRQPAIIVPRASDESSVDDFSWAYLNPKIRISKTEIVYGAHLPRMPIVHASSGSIAPQLFEGTVITSREIEGLSLMGGLYEKSKGRASSGGIPAHTTRRFTVRTCRVSPRTATTSGFSAASTRSTRASPCVTTTRRWKTSTSST